MNRPTVEQLVRGLRVWTTNHDRYVRAAVELLIEHDHWLRNDEFVRACLRRAADGGYWINWTQAERAFSAGLGGSSTERAVLDYAIALGCDRYRFNAMGSGNSSLLVKATARALGVSL